MDNKLLYEGRQVFRFTFRQGILTKGFKSGMVIVMVLLAAAGIISNIAMAFSQKNGSGVSPVQRVYIINESGLDAFATDWFLSQFQEKYPKLSFAEASGTEADVAGAMQDGAKDLIVKVAKEGQGYTVKAVVPYQSSISEGEAEEFCQDFSILVEQGKLLSTDISAEDLAMAMGEVSVNQIQAGEEDETIGEIIAKMAIPLLTVMVIYFMILVYGQSMGSVVSIEKSSKLVEYLLTLANPFSIIFGKITAMASIAVLQVFIWLGTLAGSFFLGDYIAREWVYSGYHNIVLQTLDLLRSEEAGAAFQTGAVILALFTLCLSFLFYCMLAGMVASFISKAEELAQVMGSYQVVVILAFFGAYMIPMQGKEWMITAVRIIPFTSAYVLPGDILVGNVPLGQGMLYVGILLLSIVVLVYLTGKVYKNQLFHSGQGNLLQRMLKKKAG